MAPDDEEPHPGFVSGSVCAALGAMADVRDVEPVRSGGVSLSQPEPHHIPMGFFA